MKKTGIIFFLTALFMGMASFCAAGSNEIIVSAAMSLKNAFQEIGKLYESKNSASCVLNFAATGDLLKQIAAGAPVDIFASAAKTDMDAAEEQGLMVEGTRTDFAFNRIVLIVPAQAATNLTAFEALNSGKVKKIAVGNPKSVPAGRYAEEVLVFYNLLPAIQNKFIYAENVRQVLDYVSRGEVDAGVVYATDAVVRSSAVRVVAHAPGQSHKPVVYPIGLVKGTKQVSLAKSFVALVLSDEGRAVLQKHGFKTQL